MHKLMLLVACVSLVWATPSLAAGPTSYDGAYTGTISCDALPGQQALVNEHFPLEFENGQAQYARDVRRANTLDPSAVSARGKGLVISDGDVTLTEAAQGQGWGFTATYRGRFDGTAAKLSGAQQWRLPNNGGPYTRRRPRNKSGT